MSDIYSNSLGNLVFLGNEDSSTKSAINSIATILRAIQQEAGNVGFFYNIVLPEGGGKEQRATTSIACEIDLNALETFFRRSYFQYSLLPIETANLLTIM